MIAINGHRQLFFLENHVVLSNIVVHDAGDGNIIVEGDQLGNGRVCIGRWPAEQIFVNDGELFFGHVDLSFTP